MQLSGSGPRSPTGPPKWRRPRYAYVIRSVAIAVRNHVILVSLPSQCSPCRASGDQCRKEGDQTLGDNL